MKIEIKDRILGSLLVVLGFALYFLVIPEGVVVPGSVKSVALAPDLWPRVIALILLSLGAILFVRSFLKLPDGTAETAPASGGNDAEAGATARPWGWLILGVGAFALFVFWGAIQYLGIPVASAIAIATFALLYGERRYGIILTLSVLVPLSLYFFFSQIAKVPIPMGVFA